MREIIDLNKDWYYKNCFSESDLKCKITKDFEKVDIPHTNIELPYNYFDDKAFQFISCYKKVLELPKNLKNKRVFLDFEGVMCYCDIYLNKEFVSSHKGGYTHFSVEITDFIDKDKENILTVKVDSTERKDIPPFGNVIDYITYGGIYREVWLRINEKTFISDCYSECLNVMEEDRILTNNITLDGEIENLAIKILLKKNEKIICEKSQIVDKKNIQIIMNDLKNIELWDIENPVLYTVEAILYRKGKEIDRYTYRYGFREARFTPNGFYLNGRKIKLIGLNRHQSYPYVGYAMPKRAQERDAEILKDFGVNIVRTSHYPQSRYFLDKCDEIGLLVFEEIPGWQYIGDDEWKKQVLRDVKDMIVRDRNHPSIVLWGVRINESLDNHDLYVETNRIAKELDRTRQTGGVRYFANSELLEDVYTMNDFIHDGGMKSYLIKNVKNFMTYDNTPDIDGAKIALRDQKMVTNKKEYVPYLVTEYNGHMFPTKKFDSEERLMEHALRHARVQNASFGDEHICGAIGWCAFDYNTHADFGAGDKICYHGVMDMFRIPKPAAYLYKSQKSPEKEIVLEPITYWTRGERSFGGSIPLYIMTNCDKIEFIYGDESKGFFYPCREEFPNLPHPPIKVDELIGYWGSVWKDATIVGYYKDKKVIEKKLSRNPIPNKLEITLDDNELNAKKFDTTRVVVKAIDQYGNVMPYFNDSLEIELSGPGKVIGPKKLQLIGGSIAFWVRSGYGKGKIKVKISSTRLNKEEIVIIAK